MTHVTTAPLGSTMITVLTLALGATVAADPPRPATGGAEQADRASGRPAPRGNPPDSQLTAEVEDRTTRVLAIGPSGRLELVTLAGGITVRPGPGPEVRVEIVRRSRGRTDAEARLGLEEITVSVDERADGARLATPPPARRPYRVSVSYDVTAPAGTHVTATAGLGDITIRGVQGDLTAQTTAGSITVSDAPRVVSARTFRGDVHLTDSASVGELAVRTVAGAVTLERVTMPRLDLDVTSGAVRAIDVTCRDVDLRNLEGTIEYVGPLSAGGRYRLQTHKGRIQLTVTGGTGFELEASSFSGAIRPAPDLGLTTITTTRGGLRGTVGDGAARVVATSFSGDVEIDAR